MEALLKDLSFDIFLLSCLIGGVGGLLFVIAGMKAYSVYVSYFSGDSLLSNQFQRAALRLSNEDKTGELKLLAQSRSKACPGDHWAHYYLALALYREEDYAKSREHYRRVSQLQPKMKELADESIAQINKLLENRNPSEA